MKSAAGSQSGISAAYRDRRFYQIARVPGIIYENYEENLDIQTLAVDPGV